MAEYEPRVEALLADLTCLVDVRLVRIPTFFFRKGHVVRRMEVYRGVVPEVSEEELGPDSVHDPVEHDHLVLLDRDDRCLDLYPLVQLVENDTTQHERHLCFMKSVSAKDEVLRGESAHDSTEIELKGFVDFNGLVSSRNSAE